jgi:2-polyprenyl-3-methyl-5-hydroxy-6-metoxy-1,4-benzoquinol methylase
MTYDSNSVRAYFDNLGEREWARLETDIQGRSNYAVHKRLLDEHVHPGMRVLDIGSGPGRFAIDLVSLGAEVTVADLSSVQLDLARQNLAARGLLDRVAEFRQLDVLDMQTINEDAYDVVVCFGGVVSYTRERHAEALRALRRVVRPGGVVLISVMSLYGVLRLAGPLDAAAVLESIDQHIDWQSVLTGVDVVYTRPESVEFHQPLALFTSAGLKRAVTGAGLVVETMAAANAILPVYTPVPKLEMSPKAAEVLQAFELAVCDYPGLLDAGGHLVVVARRP